MSKSLYAHRIALTIVAVSLTLKMLWLFSIPSTSILLEPDSIKYLELSQSFWSRFFGDSSEISPDTFLITPGYPFFLSLFQSTDLKAIICLQIVLSALTQILVYRLILKIASIRVAIMALTFVTLESASNLETFNVLTETLFASIFVAFLYLFDKVKSSIWVAICAGLLLGVSLLIRPIGQVLLFSIILCIAHPACRRQATIVLLISLILVGTWVIRNNIIHGVAQLSGIQSTNLLYYEGAAALSKKEGISLLEAQTRESQRESRVLRRNASLEEVVDYRISRGIELVIDNPRGLLLVHIEGIGKILFGPGVANARKLMSHFPASEVINFVYLAFGMALRLVATGLVSVSIYRIIKTGSIPPIILFSILSWTLFLVVSSGASAYSRFRVPMVPLEAMIIAYGISQLKSDARTRVLIKFKELKFIQRARSD